MDPDWGQIGLMAAVYVGGRTLEWLASKTKTKIDDRAVRYITDFVTLKFLKKKRK